MSFQVGILSTELERIADWELLFVYVVAIRITMLSGVFLGVHDTRS
jgi:hypothetical protein